MKITFIIYSLGVGGAERAITGLANTMCDDHEISIITLIKSTSFYELDPKIQQFHCFNNKITKTNFLLSVKNGLFRVHRLISLLKSVRPEVVVSFMHTSNIYAIWATKLLQIPCIISERANHAIDKISISHKIVRNLSYPFCSKLIVQTNGNKSYYSKVLNIRKIEIIPNAISSQLSKRRLGLDASKRELMILNVGTFKNGKAQDLLIRAFAGLSENNWRLVFLGDGANLSDYKKLAEKLGVSKRIHFEGSVKNIAHFYNNAGMFVFTSEHEGFPNALLEALYFGIPAISTNCDFGPSELITNGENGFLIPVGDLKGLVEKMEVLMMDWKLRQILSENAIKSTKNYEMEHISKMWFDVIYSLN